MIDFILLEGLGPFFSDEFDEYNLEECRDKIKNDHAFMNRLQHELLDILDNCEEVEIDLRD